MHHIDMRSYSNGAETLVYSYHTEHTLEDAIVSAAIHAVGQADGLAPYVVRAVLRTDGASCFHAVDVTDRVIAAANEAFAAHVAATK